MTCRVCGAEACANKNHERARVVSLGKQLRRRMIRTHYESVAWARYIIRAEKPIPLVFYVNPPDADLASPFWVQTQKVAGRINHTAVRLIRAAGPPAEEIHFFHSRQPLFTRSAILRGRSEDEYFVLSSEKRTLRRREFLGGGYINFFADQDWPFRASGQICAEADGIAVGSGLQWVPEGPVGTFRTATVQDRTFDVTEEPLRVYDHRPADDSLARVEIVQKRAGPLRWFHVNLYPSQAATAVGRMFVGTWSSVFSSRRDNEKVLWAFQSTSRSKSGRKQSTTVLIVTVDPTRQAAGKIESLRQAAIEAIARNDFIEAAICLEDMVVEMIGSGQLEPTEESEKLWAKYQAIKARALRTSFDAEADTAWRAAVRVLLKLTQIKEDEYG